MNTRLEYKYAVLWQLVKRQAIYFVGFKKEVCLLCDDGIYLGRICPCRLRIDMDACIKVERRTDDE